MPSKTAPLLEVGKEGGPVILQQPEDVVVAYPEGASFSVMVDHPENVASYQWIMLDKESNVFILDGVTAATNTLIIPSTVGSNQLLRFYCVITDQDGNWTKTDMATLDLSNRYTYKPVFYVGEYALEPGDSLDLSTIDHGDGHKLGSGTVVFDANGTDITITDLDFDNTYATAGLALAPNVGLDFEFYEQDREAYTFTFQGDNRIMNTYYDYDYNLGGIPFDFYFNGTQAVTPLVTLTGDGTLTITNGFNALRVIGDLKIDMDITVKQTFNLYADGICANNLMVADGAKLDLTVYGSALYAKGNLYLQGADITVQANAPHISMGTATKNLLHAIRDIRMEDSKVDISATADQAVCGRVIGYSGIYSMNDIEIYHSDVSYAASVNPGDALYASQFAALIADGSGTLEDSAFHVNIDSPEIYTAYGVYAGSDFSLLRSTADVNVHSSGLAFGIAPERDFNAENASVTMQVSSSDQYRMSAAYGIVSENAVFKFSDPRQKVDVTATDGIALGCSLGEAQDEPAEYQEGYVSRNIYLRDGAVCLTPEQYAVSYGSMDRGEDAIPRYLMLETVYDQADTAKPAQNVVLGLEPAAFTDVQEDDFYYAPVAWAAANGVTNGTTSSTFSPGKNCTRAEIITFLWRACGAPAPAATACPFTDVDMESYYSDAVLWAVENGITEGTSETTFSPKKTCTRAEIITLLWRSSEKPQAEASTLPFLDVDTDGYYYPAVLWAVEQGVTLGTSETAFSPDRSCTRGEAVTFLWRAMAE